MVTSTRTATPVAGAHRCWWRNQDRGLTRTTTATTLASSIVLRRLLLLLLWNWQSNVFNIIDNRVTFVSAQQQQYQHQQQRGPVPTLRTEEELEDLAQGKHQEAVIIRLDPRNWHSISLLEFKPISDQMMQLFHASSMGSAYTVDCAKTPGVCIAAIRTIPTHESIFARKRRGAQNEQFQDHNVEIPNDNASPVWETYGGPKNLDSLRDFFMGEPQTPSLPQDRHPTNAQNLEEGTAVCDDPETDTINNEVVPPPRPTGQGVYIYDEPWARVLDRDCDVTTMPTSTTTTTNTNTAQNNDNGNDINVGEDVPITDADSNPHKLRDAGYFAVLRSFLQHTIDHVPPLVVTDPEQARWFLIPFDVDRSYAMRDDTDRCNSTHLQRLHTVLEGLQSSKFYHRRGGTDHIMALMHYLFAPWRRQATLDHGYPPNSGYIHPDEVLANEYFPHSQFHVIANMTLMRYIGGGARPKLPSSSSSSSSSSQPSNTSSSSLSQPGGVRFPDDRRISEPRGFVPSRGSKHTVWWIEGEDWRCTVTVPVITPHAVESLPWNKTFEAWLERPYLLNYRGNGAKIPAGGSQELHVLMYAMKSLYPDSIISQSHAPRHEYAEELTQSKFCVVVRGDDPMRSRFNDAIAAGCIPIIIADGWDMSVTPLHDGMDYRSFTVMIPESMFLAHAPSALYYAYGLPQRKLRSMHASLMKHRPFVCWGLQEGPDKSVGARAWQSINEYCDVDKF